MNVFRRPITHDEFNAAIRLIESKVYSRISEKGAGAYVSPHETAGVIAEEWQELLEALRTDDPAEVLHELIDLAVACIFGVASLEVESL